MGTSDRRTDKAGRLGFSGKLFFGLAAICAVTIGSVVAATAASANRNRETIFGESAGAESIYSQPASRLAADLFQQAISESEAYALPDVVDASVPLSQAELAGTVRVASLGSCSNQTSQCGRTLMFLLLLRNSGSRAR
jgi:Carboxylesterase family